MQELFKQTKQNISLHISNVFKVTNYMPSCQGILDNYPGWQMTEKLMDFTTTEANKQLKKVHIKRTF
jgi:hypothetical protein